MIHGTVSADLEATVGLIVLAGTGQQQPIHAILDSGFSGFLTLASALIASLGLAWLGRDQGIWADGSTQFFDVYRAIVLWDGAPRPVEVEAVDGPPLLGMALLQGHDVRITVVVGGDVTILAVP